MPGRSRPAQGVLNAFRHHRGGHVQSADAMRGHLDGCSTPFGITEGGMDDRRWRLGGSVACSTPFGITEGGMWSGPRFVRLARVVLNAFRHHRGGHASEQVYGYDRQVGCSTPFGITEGGMRRDDGVQGRGHGAQRLSASQRGACRSWGMSRRVILVLNAFRHHRGGHAGPDRDRVLVKCSTPFGITEGGMPEVQQDPDHAGRCSTPFGITEGGMQPGNATERNASKCSTPFGITEGGIGRIRRGRQHDRGAQRLSASQRGACDDRCRHLRV